ncbi:lysylphosphatidylglycerol synthase domain-containing protein [Litorimonas sp. WD9-15]|uniref:lysylphosphatidylglycerol synthase domain-containing protein n=1 Tax=Litorimonas sp. WD9-15 TaxID=3418716 RepID=UPI003CFDE196
MKYLKIGISVLVWLLLIWFLFKTLDRLPSWAEWAGYMSGPIIMAIGVFALCFLAATGLRAFRFGFLLRKVVVVPWKNILTDFPWLLMIGAVTPLRLGEGYRAVWVRKFGSHSLSVIALWIAERLIDLFMLVLILSVTIALNGAFEAGTRGIATGVIAALLLGYLLTCFFLKPLVRFVEARPHMTRLGEIGRALSVVNTLPNHAVMLSTSLAIWLFIGSGFTAIMSASAPVASPGLFGFASTALVNLAGIFSVMPGNVGGYQAVVVAASEPFGFPETSAFMASVILMSVALTITITLGLCALLIRRFILKADA